MITSLNFNFRQYSKGCHVHYVITNTSQEKMRVKFSPTQGSVQSYLSGGYPGAELLARMQYKYI